MDYKDSAVKKILITLGGLIAAILVFTFSNIPAAPRIVAGVFTLVVIFWITEVFPLYVTAMLGPFLLAVFLGPLAKNWDVEPYNFKIFLHPFASPVVVLLLGGFLMARVFSTYHLDAEFSGFFISRFGKKPKVILLGFMGLTAFMSMWMSNTATTAIMVATILPIVRDLPERSNFKKALMLGIPFAANIGGMATPIGTPPNAIAIGMLAGSKVGVTFFQWTCAGIGPVVIMLLVSWFLLLKVFPTKQTSLDIKAPEADKSNKITRTVIYTTIVVTILLWLTDAVHGIHASVIAIFPVLVFTTTGIAGKRILRDVSWEVLFLVGGGIAMGVAITETGLSDIIIGTLNLKGIGLLWVGLILAFVAASLSTIMSNTASANLLIPIAISVSSFNPAFMAISVAICASMGMGLPVSTPPNAIAYGSGMISIKDMFKVGARITVIGVVLTVLYEYFLLSLFIN